MDQIVIRGVQLPVRIGCEPGERELPQTLELDLEIALRDSRAAKSGKLEDTVCYKTAVDEVRRFAVTREWSLIEVLAEDVAGLLFESFPAASTVTLELRKFILPGTRSAGLRISRERED